MVSNVEALKSHYERMQIGSFRGINVVVSWGIDEADRLVLLDDLLGTGRFRLLRECDLPDGTAADRAIREAFGITVGVTVSGVRYCAISRVA